MLIFQYIKDENDATYMTDINMNTFSNVAKIIINEFMITVPILDFLEQLVKLS